MFPDADLTLERAAASPLFGRVIFVLATEESGAELVVRALGCLDGVTVVPAPTDLFKLGMDLLLHFAVAARDPVRDHGLSSLVGDEEVLSSARSLADDLLIACSGGQGAWVVDYSPSHIRFLEAMRAIYPDAEYLHIVSDGRDVAARLASRGRARASLRPAPVPAADAPPAREGAQRWCDDQRAVDDELGDHPNLKVARIERVLAEPATFLDWLTSALGIEAAPDAMERAVATLGGGEWELPSPSNGRARALVQELGADLLADHDYGPRAIPTADALAARLELGVEGAAERARRVRDNVRGRYRAAQATFRASLASRAES